MEKTNRSSVWWDEQLWQDQQMMYGNETWLLTQKKEDRYSVTERRMLRYSHNFDREDHESIWEKVKIEAIAVSMRRQRLQWYGHVCRREGEHMRIWGLTTDEAFDDWDQRPARREYWQRSKARSRWNKQVTSADSFTSLTEGSYGIAWMQAGSHKKKNFMNALSTCSTMSGTIDRTMKSSDISYPVIKRKKL